MSQIAKIKSAALFGLEASPVDVEADIGAGLPALTVVGLPDKAIEESKERVRAAIRNTGASMPQKRITINLAPADIKKEGPAYDLPIALGILTADGQMPADILNDTLVLGELALNGGVRRVNGILSIMLEAQHWGIKKVFVPRDNAKEAALVRGIDVYGVGDLGELLAFAKGRCEIPKTAYEAPPRGEELKAEFDFAEVRGQENAKRALELAAAGHHNILMSGPPGSGKTMLARALAGILPVLSVEEILEVTRLYSVAGTLKDGLVKHRPFRSPHHTTSSVALVGGGTVPKPGEISLAHKGVLFLDEFPEFPRSVLEALRQPLEDRIVTVSRAQGTVAFPADFLLVASQNPCPCGFLYDPVKQCHCSPYQIQKYQRKISGPLVDRIDLHVEVPRLSYEKMTGSDTHQEDSKTVRARVEAARQRQSDRLGAARTNSQMKNAEIKEFCALDEEGQKLMKQAVNNLQLSGRGYVRTLKLARTIADLNGKDKVDAGSLAEALQYRPRQKDDNFA